MVHKELAVWKNSIDLVVGVYAASSLFPPDEKFGLTSQMRRAAVSIPSNIAEGCARNSTKELKQFLSIAQGSLAELETQLLISKRLGFNDDYESLLLEQMDHIGRMLNSLIKKLG